MEAVEERGLVEAMGRKEQGEEHNEKLEYDLEMVQFIKGPHQWFYPHTVSLSQGFPQLWQILCIILQISLSDSETQVSPALGWEVGCQEIASRDRTQMDTKVSMDDDRNLPTKDPDHHCPWHAAAFADSNSVRLIFYIYWAFSICWELGVRNEQNMHSS